MGNETAAELAKGIRKRRGWSQRELAAQVGLGVHHKTVSRWERGESQPSLRYYLRLQELRTTSKRSKKRGA